MMDATTAQVHQLAAPARVVRGALTYALERRVD
jgi:hypothetical protein